MRDGTRFDAVAFSAPLRNLVAVDVSPGGTFLVTFQRPSKESAGEKPARNLKVWRMPSPGAIQAEGAPSPAPVFSQVNKSASKETWPVLQFSADDALAFRSVANEIHVLRTAAFAGEDAKGPEIHARLRVKGLGAFAVARERVAAYVAEAKGAPASVQVFALDPDAGTFVGGSPEPVARRSFFRSSRAQLLFNAPGTALLVLAQADVDATNQSYYGEQALHFVGLCDESGGVDNQKRVDLKEGPIHDVQWSPIGTHFVAVHGFMPAKATLFDAKGVPIYDFGSGPRNTVRWSPFGRFLCLGGFGNLPGDLEFFDKKADGKCKPTGAVRAPCTVACAWAPDGRHVVCATTSPRLRVDNGFKVFGYTGNLVAERKAQVLLEVAWGPGAGPDGRPRFADRPASPERVKRALQAAKAGGGAGGAAQRPAAYVPPHLKNARSGPPGSDPAAGGAGASSARFSLAHDAKEAAPGKIRAGGRATGGGSSGGVPGAGPVLSKSAAKNAKRRAKAQAKKKASASDGAGAVASPPAPSSDATATAGGGEGPPSEPMAAVVVDVPKKIRALEKKLRQIDQLKAKGLSRDALSEDQAKKLDAEEGIRKEIAQLKAMAA